MVMHVLARTTNFWWCHNDDGMCTPHPGQCDATACGLLQLCCGPGLQCSNGTCVRVCFCQILSVAAMTGASSTTNKYPLSPIAQCPPGTVGCSKLPISCCTDDQHCRADGSCVREKPSRKFAMCVTCCTGSAGPPAVPPAHHHHAFFWPPRAHSLCTARYQSCSHHSCCPAVRVGVFVCVVCYRVSLQNAVAAGENVACEWATGRRVGRRQPCTPVRHAGFPVARQYRVARAFWRPGVLVLQPVVAD